MIRQIITTPPPVPTAQEIIDAALATAQDAMEALDRGSEPTPLMRALALIVLGHPCWFAVQRDRHFIPVSAGGGILHAGSYRTTLDAAKLQTLPRGNTVIFDIALPDGTAYPCVFDLQFGRCGPFDQYIDGSV